jgi:methyl-accepting chemotaxis protein
LVGSVHAISMQSHLLAINAAIEGSRAGPAGAAFRVVADEMRLLAKNSSEVALKINQGLGRARVVVEGGMSTRIAESNKALSDVSHAVGAIQKLQENFEDMSQYFKTRFTVITRHNQNLATDIAAVLGHIQYQDVVSQSIDRIRMTTMKRNEFFKEALAKLNEADADPSYLSPSMALILNEFLAEEDKHKHSARHDEQTNGELKFELF